MHLPLGDNDIKSILRCVTKGRQMHIIRKVKGGIGMSFLQELLRILDTSMEVPQPYGWFHLLWCALTVLATVALCLLYKKGIVRNVRSVVLITAVIVTVLEVYKQINYTFSYEDGIKADFLWYAFPWQFCSMPMYVGLLAGVTKGRLHRALCAFLASYAVFAGVCVMLIPTSVFTHAVGINIQTMVCHGSMITIGAFLMYTGYVKPEHTTVLRALPVFGVGIAVAILINWLGHHTGAMGGGVLNAFFICPDCPPHLPVYSLVQPLLPGWLSIAVYIAGFTLASYLMVLIGMGAKTLGARQRKKAVV